MSFLFFVLVTAAPTSTDSFSKTLKEYKSSVSFSTRDAQGSEKFQVNGEAPLAPASVAKVVSSACAFETLSPAFQFETLWGTSGAIRDHILEGDLVVKGAGDPSFVIEDLREILAKLKSLYGIREIKGKLVLDLSYFGQRSLSLSEGFEGDKGRSFTTDLTALPFDHNSFAIWTYPVGNSYEVQLWPPQAGIKISSKVHIGTATSLSVNYDPAKDLVMVTGSLAAEAEPKASYRGLKDPLGSFAAQVSQIWQEMGGIWKEKNYVISLSAVPAKTLWVHRSKALSKILMDINKLSTNFGAELVLLAAAEKKYGRPATYEKGQKLLAECVRTWGLSPEGLKLENASGLSRNSRMQTSELTRFFSVISSRYYFPEFLTTLSLLGQDGTTRSRLTGSAGKARIKTGSLQGVRSIAGYIQKKGGTWDSFALLFNCPSCSGDAMKKTEDDILQDLLKQP